MTVEPDPRHTVALIVAGGSGQRFSSEIPKQYQLLAGKPLIRHTIERFIRHPKIGQVQVVIGCGQDDLYFKAIGDLNLPPPVGGGANRQASVYAGLNSLRARAPKLVLIHDAARPFVEANLIDRVIEKAAEGKGAIPALPTIDSLRQVKNGQIIGDIDRNLVFRVQTPQAFPFAAILTAHETHKGANMSDDGAVAMANQIIVETVPGDEGNFKVTHENDLERAERNLHQKEQTYRTGMGFDVHRFGPGDGVILCGIKISHDRSLIGHSDADVALHAITDAILGTAGLDDIGTHFPPNDPQWQGQSSDLFLTHALTLLEQAGGQLGHIDLTLICQAPRIGPHRQALRDNLVALTGLPLSAISVKATTTEGLGFTGRGEGIAAQAIATAVFTIGSDGIRNDLDTL